MIRSVILISRYDSILVILGIALSAQKCVFMFHGRGILFADFIYLVRGDGDVLVVHSGSHGLRSVLLELIDLATNTRFYPTRMAG